MIYDRRFGLPQSVANYLNQPLPNISGIFSLPQASEILSSPQQEVQEYVSSSMLTPEQLALLYPQSDSGGGEGRDETDNRIDNNAGIYSFKDLKNYALSLPPAARIGGLAFGPLGFIGGLIGTNIADKFGFTQAGRDRIARETAAQRGADKQKIENLKNFNQNYKSYFSGDGGNNNQGGGTFGDSVNDAGSFSDYS